MTLTDNSGNSITFSHNSQGRLQIDAYNINGNVGNGPILVGGITGVDNGLSLNGTVGELGGPLTADVVITTLAHALTINGSLKFQNISSLSSPQHQALVLDPSTGAVATAPIAPQAGSITASGGDVTGTIPTLNIGTGKVTGDKLATGAVTDDKVANGINYSKLTGVPAFLLGSATISTGDLSGTYLAPVIKPQAVTAAKIADHSITATKVDGTQMITSVSINGGAKQYGDVAISTLPALNVPVVLSGNVTLTPAQTGMVFTYTGSTDIVVTLPATTAGLKYTIYVNGTGKVKIQAVTTDPISIGGIKTDAGCWIENNTAEAEVQLNCYMQHKWVCSTLQGDWNFSGVA